MTDGEARRGGFLAGALTGLVLSGVLAVALALLSPLPVDAPMPGVTPVPEETQAGTTPHPGPAAPAEAAPEASPAATAPGTPPAETPSATPPAAPPPAEATPKPATDASPLPDAIPVPAAPPQPEPGPDRSTPAAPEPGSPRGAVLPEPGDQPAPPPVAEAAGPDRVSVAAPVASDTARPPAEGAAPGIATLPEAAPAAPPLMVLATPPAPEAPPVADAPADPPPPGAIPTPMPASPAPIPDKPAWRAHAATPPARIDGPLLAVLLEVGGRDADRLAGIAGTRLPVSFVLRSDDPEAPRIAEVLGKAGYELFLALTGPQALSPGLSDEEVKARIETALARVPGAVGIVDLDGPLGRDTALSTATVRALMKRGNAVVTVAAGARNVMARIAPDHGIRHMIADRRLGPDPTADDILSALERGAFIARNSGSAVILAGMGERAVQALVGWAMARDDRLVKLVPGSAVLARAGEDG